MSYEFFIALRYLRSKRRTRFVSIITYISVGGVLVGVAALVVVLSLFNGFESEVRDRIIGERAHINVFSLVPSRPVTRYDNLMRQIKTVNHVVGTAPFVFAKAMFSPLSSTSSVDGVVVIGIDPEQERRVSRLHENILFGELDLSRAPLPEEENGRDYPGIVIGRGLADRMGIIIGQKVALANLQGVSLGVSFTPRVNAFRVTGIFETGLYEYDASFTYIALAEAQRLFRLEEGVTGIAVRVDDRDRSRLVAAHIEAVIEQAQERAEETGVAPKHKEMYFTVDWRQQNQSLFRWMTLEKWAAFIVLNLIILVAAFNIVSTLIMVVLEKTKEIGILKSMGATASSMMKIFIFQGSVVGVFGTVLGCIAGFALCWAQATFEFISLPADIYLIHAVPIRMQAMDFISVALGSMAICVLATVYPAWKAARLIPVEAIRYEG